MVPRPRAAVKPSRWRPRASRATNRLRPDLMSFDRQPESGPDPALVPLATIPLRPFRTVSRPLVMLLSATATIFTLVVMDTRTPLAVIAGVYAALGFVAFLAFGRRRLAERPPIVVTHDAVVLPTGSLTARTRAVAIDDVTS